MTRFSVGGGDDREAGPSNRPPKRPREDDPCSTPNPTPTSALTSVARTRALTSTPNQSATAIRTPPAPQLAESVSDDDDSSGSDKEQPLPPVDVNSGQVASTAIDDTSFPLF